MDCATPSTDLQARRHLGSSGQVSIGLPDGRGREKQPNPSWRQIYSKLGEERPSLGGRGMAGPRPPHSPVLAAP